jgi:hypothetical protein
MIPYCCGIPWLAVHWESHRQKSGNLLMLRAAFACSYAHMDGGRQVEGSEGVLRSTTHNTEFFESSET